MAYEKTNWTSTTPINTTNLNKMEAGIKQNNDSIDEVKNIVNKVDNKFNYSTEEQMIGTWIDGKPLYRKYIDIGNLASSGGRKLINLSDYGIEATNVKKWNVYKNDGAGIYSDISSAMVTMSGELVCRTILYSTDNQLIIASGTVQDISSHTAYAILEYIKTTDTVG